MTYSGGLRPGYAELMMSNGIPLYSGKGPETGFEYRCKLRPIRHSKTRIWVNSVDGFGLGIKISINGELMKVVDMGHTWMDVRRV